MWVYPHFQILNQLTIFNKTKLEYYAIGGYTNIMIFNVLN